MSKMTSFSACPSLGPQPNQQCEQGFWQGANAWTSLPPAYSTSTTTSNLPGYLDDICLDISDSLEVSSFDAFKDIYLAESDEAYFMDVNSEHLFPDLADLQLIEPQKHINQAVLEVNPQVTIKLKKVKCPKKKCSNLVNSSLANEIFTFVNTEVAEYLCSPSYQDSSAIVHEADKVFCESSLTLKDIMNMENADLILENSLTTDPTSPYYPSSDLSDLFGSEDDSEYLNISSPSLSLGSSLSPQYIEVEPQHSDNEEVHFIVDDVIEGSPSKGFNKIKKSRSKFSPEFRYLRKKEQNKQAALRYRAKKKDEEQQLGNELKSAEEIKKELEKNKESLKQEISFMKKLMRETLIAKKAVPFDAFN